MKATISGKEFFVVGNTLIISKAVKQFSTCSFLARVFKNNDTFPSQGEGLVVYDDNNNKIFSGVIKTVLGSNATSDGGIDFNISCMGNDYYVYKKVMVKSYVNRTSGYIVDDIFKSYLKEEGIAIGKLEAGKLVKEVVLNYVYGNEALNKLAELNGFWWNIDNNKKLFFVKNEEFVAPFPLTFNETIGGSVTVNWVSPDYRNIVFLPNTKGITDLKTQTFRGDGENTSFPLSNPVAEMVSVEVSTDAGPYEAKTTGTKGNDKTKQFYWANNDAIVSHETNLEEDEQGNAIEPRLGVNQILKVTYRGLFDVVVSSRNANEIIRKSKIEKSTGKFERVKETAIRGISNALDFAEADLETYSQEGTIVTYKTLRSGLDVGMLQTVTLPNYDIKGEKFLVSTINIAENDGVIIYTVQLVKGPAGNDWVNFFVKGERGNRVNRISLGTTDVGVVTPVHDFAQTWKSTQYPNLFGPYIYTDGDIYGNNSEFITLDKTTPIKFLAWFDANGVEMGRTPIQQTIRENKSLMTITTIPKEVTGVIKSLKWLGGTYADIVIGTKPVNFNKTALEILQINRVDLKGW